MDDPRSLGSRGIEYVSCWTPIVAKTGELRPAQWQNGATVELQSLLGIDDYHVRKVSVCQALEIGT